MIRAAACTSFEKMKKSSVSFRSVPQLSKDVLIKKWVAFSVPLHEG